LRKKREENKRMIRQIGESCFLFYSDILTIYNEEEVKDR